MKTKNKMFDRAETPRRPHLAATTRVVTVTLLLVLGMDSSAPAQTIAANEFPDYELVMYDRPSVVLGNSYGVFQDGLKDLWLKALERDDPELQRLVIDTLSRAHQKGLEGLTDVVPQLIEIAQQPNQRVDVVAAVVRALIAMDRQQDGPTLVELASRHGLPVSQIVEPALKNWNSTLLSEAWIERITEAEADTASLALAVRGLATLQETDAVDPLKVIIRSASFPTPLRLEAADALAQITSTGSAEFAKELLEQRDSHAAPSQVLAIKMLASHTDELSVQVLKGLVDDDNSAVQATALHRLYEIDFRLVSPFAKEKITSRDVNVRTTCARTLIDEAEFENIAILAEMLDDVNPSLRREVASGLVRLAATDELKGEILERTTAVLNRQSWRGCEQACAVLARLDHKPSGPRMVELLEHERGEVQVASAWGLTQLRIEDLLPGMLAHSERVLAGFLSGEISDRQPGASLHQAHLFIAFGDQGYAEAEPLLLKYVPKNLDLGVHSRAAAAWALGLLHVDDPEPELVRKFIQRMRDVGSIPGETEEMIQMCAVACGRMKAKEAMPTFREYAPNGGQVGRRCWWAIQQITGEEIPEPNDSTYQIGGWFMRPIEEE